MTLSRSNPRSKQRWTLLGAVVLVLTLIGAFAAQAQVNTTLFELDKDATNNTDSVKIGVLNAAVSAGSTSPISLQVCQDEAAGAYNGATILIDAERLTLGTGTAASGGGCPTGFTFKVSYTGVTRTVAAGTNTGHSKGENVTQLVSGDDTSMPGADWDQVYDLIGDPPDPDEKCETLGAAECTWTADGRAMSIFTSSKDYAEIDTWQWRDQSVPDSNELDHGFAVKYVDGSGDQHLYFGADRFATEGAKDAGFWFFKDTVFPNALPASGDGTFTGLHTAPDPGDNGVFCGITGQTTPNCAPYDDDDSGGDVLILTTFTNGGAVTTIRVFEWIGPAGSDAALLERGNAGDCASLGTPIPAMCATVNDTTIESPWTYSGKNEPAVNQIAAGGFLEGGLNLTDLGLEGCFSSFMATSRSSPSLTADPKDFILGNFEACESSLTTTPKGASGLSTPLTADSDGDNLDEISIGSGSVQVTDTAVLDVMGTTDFEGTLNFYLCGPLANPGACDDTGVEIGAADGVNPVTANGTYTSAVATLTEVGRYCWYATFESDTPGLEAGADDGTIESEEGTGECFEVMPVTPTLSTAAVAPSVNFGQPVQDNATLGGTATQPGDNGGHATYDSINATNGASAGGKIVFTLLGPDSCTETNNSTTSGDTNPQDFTPISGDGQYGPVSYTPGAPGTYHWKAEYVPATGDPNNLGTTHNADCMDSNETVVVQKAPTSITTSQFVYPNDSAMVSVAAANQSTGFVAGSVKFRLFDSLANCTAATPSDTVDQGGLLYREIVNLPGTEYSSTVETDNTSVRVSTNTTVYWLVEFSSTNQAQFGRVSVCAESTQTVFVNDSSGGTQP